MTARYVGWRTKSMYAFPSSYKLVKQRRGNTQSMYELANCTKCQESTLHQPKNSKGCRIVCWECA